MALPWLIGAAAVGLAAALLSDSDEDKKKKAAEEEERQRRIEEAQRKAQIEQEAAERRRQEEAKAAERRREEARQERRSSANATFEAQSHEFFGKIRQLLPETAFKVTNVYTPQYYPSGYYNYSPTEDNENIKGDQNLTGFIHTFKQTLPNSEAKNQTISNLLYFFDFARPDIEVGNALANVQQWNTYGSQRTAQLAQLKQQLEAMKSQLG